MKYIQYWILLGIDISELNRVHLLWNILHKCQWSALRTHGVVRLPANLRCTTPRPVFIVSIASQPICPYSYKSHNFFHQYQYHWLLWVLFIAIFWSNSSIHNVNFVATDGILSATQGRFSVYINRHNLPFIYLYESCNTSFDGDHQVISHYCNALKSTCLLKAIFWVKSV